MPFKHKLSRRLALLFVAAVAAVSAGCADAPTNAAEEVPVRSPDLDPTLAVTGSNVIGLRVRTDRYVHVYAQPSRRASRLGHQRDGALGTILADPTAATSSDPYPFVQINFDAGADGWVLAAYVSLLEPVAPPPPPPVVVAPVASISLSPSTASLLIGGSTTLVATLRDSAGNTLSGRTVAWQSSVVGVATVSGGGTVTGIAAGSAIVTATSEGRSATASVSVTAPVVPPPSPTAPSNFASRWLTATGTSTSAFLDANNATPWGFVCCSSNTNTSIVTPASLSLQKWPAGNVYRVGTQASLQNAINTHVIQTDVGTPAANSHRYFRYYLQVTYGDDHGAASETNIEHGVETAATTNAGGRGMNFYRIPRNDGTWFPAYREISSGVRFIGGGLRLLKNRTYRLEWHLAYGVSTYSVEVRIYDEDGNLAATEGDFYEIAPSRNLNSRLGAWSFTYTAEDHRYFRVGTNGPNSNFPMLNMRDENLFLHGAVAVCATSWCGPVAP